jgi:Glycosyltransferase family 29 (sialyltransferase)
LKICIVGHGPSLKGSKLGKEIDSHDKVVRLKGSACVIRSEDYGSKVDAICASTEVMGNFFKFMAPEYWAYPKNGHFNPSGAINVIARLERPVMIPLEHCNYWNQRFRQMGAQHPNVSTGTAAILIAIKRWCPKKIILAGFDTLMDPSVPFDRNMDIPRTGDGPYPNHDWEKEKLLLRVLSHVYGVSIEPLDSRHDLLQVGL